MSKSDISYSHIWRGAVYRKPNKPQFRAGGPVHGLDTETAEGKPFLLTVAFDDGRTESYHDFPHPLPPEKIFEILTNRNLRSSTCVWYNLDFDANVILGILPERCLYEIAVVGATEWEGYEILYIPGKALIIKDSNEHQYRHFDIAQFFFTSLEKASQEWLGEGKKNEGLDVSRFGLDKNGEVNEYIRKNWETILEYGEYDSELGRNLWIKFSDAAEALKIPTAKPYSTGYLAEQTYNVIFEDSYKPGFGSSSMQEIAWEAYRGGRFEITERGAVGQVTTVDINSAYPHILRNLPDPSTLEWRYRKAPRLEEIREADYGYVRAWVRTDPNRKLQPFAEKKEGLLFFPAHQWTEITELIPTFVYGIDAGWIQEFQIVEAHLANDVGVTRFPFRWVNDLYKQRKKYQAEGNQSAQLAIKIVLNSLYGKLAQVTLKTESHSADDEIKKWWLPVAIEEFPEHIRKHLIMEGIEFHKEAHAGRYWNPFLAGHITGLTRLELLKAVVETGLEDSCIMLATDSIMLEKTAFENSSFLSRFGGKELGRWEVEKSGDAFVVGCGIYEIQPDEGDPILCNRGFSAGIGAWQVDVDSLRAAAEVAEWDAKKSQSVIPVTNTRPLKIGQAVWQRAAFDFSEIGKFLEFPKGIAAGMDRKREWPEGSSVTFSRLLEGPEISTPRILDAEKRSL